MQIRQLETEIGAKVFVRAPRHVILTEAGEQLLRRARHILRESMMPHSMKLLSLRGRSADDSE